MTRAERHAYPFIQSEETLLTQRSRSMRENADFSNAYAEFGRITGNADPDSVQYYPVHKDDLVQGEVSEPTLKTAAAIYDIEQQIMDLKEALEFEHEVGRRMRLTTNLDELHLLLMTLLGFYFWQLHMERNLQTWSGPAIFTIREGGVAVIRKEDLKSYQQRAVRPHKSGSTYEIHRKIVRAQFVPQKP